MKEKDLKSCLQCRNIICRDLDGGRRAMGNILEGSAITFPENVEFCPRRMSDDEWWELYSPYDVLNLGS